MNLSIKEQEKKYQSHIYQSYVGIDVSKSKLDVTILTTPSEKHLFHFVVSNDNKGINQLLNQLENQKIDKLTTLFCFEDTGVYSLPLGCFLSEQKLNYWMIPAIEIKRSKGISRGKTDKTDSKDIAFYSYTHLHKLRLSQIPEKAILELKLLFTEREKLLKATRLMESTQEGIGYLPKEVLVKTLKLNKNIVKQLKTAITKVDNTIKQIIEENEAVKKQFELIQSQPGIGPQTALYLILVTKSFQSFENWRQLACYSGVAPFEYSSGSSIRGRTKVSHLADKKLKTLLNLCALNAKKWDPQLKEYYEKKVAEGKPKMLVLNNLRAKLLARVFAIINRGTPYVNFQNLLHKKSNFYLVLSIECEGGDFTTELSYEAHTSNLR